MAHRADIIQVHKNFPTRESKQTVVDPNCGRELAQGDAQSMIFRTSETLYFCSKACREEYLSKKHKPQAA